MEGPINDIISLLYESTARSMELCIVLSKSPRHGLDSDWQCIDTQDILKPTDKRVCRTQLIDWGLRYSMEWAMHQSLFP